MARRPASPPSADDLAILPSGGVLPETGAAPPDWIRIAPAGLLNCRDGRAFQLDPGRLVTRFQADKVDIPIDLGHATASDSKAPALGWIDRLEARADGLWGHVREWLKGGRDVLQARTHRYISPAFNHDEAGSATWLHSVALVAVPALAMDAVLGAAAPNEARLVAELAAALGLETGATRAACLRAVTEMAATAVPLTIHQRALASLAATQEELATLKAQVRTSEVERVLEEGLKSLKIVPAERGEYLALCATDAGLDSVKRLLKVMPPKVAPSGLDRRPVPEAEPQALDRNNPAALAAAATTLLHERERKGLQPISFADAMVRVLNDPSRA